MLRHSYKVELQRLRISMKALELDLAMNPHNERAQQKMAQLQQEAQWFENRIATGTDPGAITL